MPNTPRTVRYTPRPCVTHPPVVIACRKPLPACVPRDHADDRAVDLGVFLEVPVIGIPEGDSACVAFGVVGSGPALPSTE